MMNPSSYPAMNMLFVVKYVILAFLFGDLAIAAITSSKTENLEILTISTRDTGRGSAGPHGHFYASVAPPAQASDLPDLQLSNVPNYSRFWARSIPTIHPARAQHKAHFNTSPFRKRNTTRILYTNAKSAQPKESSYSCKGSRQCKYLDPIRDFCNAASAYIKPDNYYGYRFPNRDDAAILFFSMLSNTVLGPRARILTLEHATAMKRPLGRDVASLSKGRTASS